MNQEEWDRANGASCPNCEKETFRMIDGICIQCYRDAVAEEEKKKEDRTERRYYRDELRKGTISLSQLKDGRL